ncbi:hypothetical protein [Arthrobacter sp. ISL-65]|uniref:hypothetical protein n=1 Tax=Arthrobacter sp. ISL-65 TaxID=2819112 RepID=UPI001BE6DB55|nr:hypothetical protein [Arthrobacter sp. ISL-65]MBT2550312.1 hypothetical protein [Arthrobacter sp. ISL-65]
MGSENMAQSRWAPISRRRFGWGLIAAFLAGVLGFAVHTAAIWSLEAGVTRLFFLVLSDWQLIFGAHLLSGVTGATGLALLAPPLIRRITRTWLRRLAAVLVVLAAAAAALPWLLYLVGIGLNAASATYTRVTAETGESVIVEQSGFDRGDYAVYRQEAPFLYERSAEGKSVSDAFDPGECTLADRAADLLLTCGVDSVPVPPLDAASIS